MALRWIQHVEGGPRRVNHAAVAVRGRFIFSFGGYCTGEDYFSIHKLDVHIFDIVPCRWSKLQTPASEDQSCIPYMRYGHSASIVSDIVYIFGGRSDSYGACNKLFCFDTISLKWSRPVTQGHSPAARDGHTACVIENRIYIFGGYEEEGECFSNAVEYLDTNSLSWHKCKITGIELPASWRDFHTATAVGTDMYIFGGRGDVLGPYHSGQEIYTNTVSIFNSETNSWRTIKPSGDVPIGRRSHSSIYHNNYLYVFGGYNGREKEHYNDIYRLDTRAHVWSRMDVPGLAPCPRRRHCWCLLGSSSVIFGGTSPIAGATTDDEFSLQDHSDLYVLDFDPSLRTLCKIAVLEHKLDTSLLPKVLRMELKTMEPVLITERSSHG